MLAGTCKIAGGCAKYAFSGFTPGGAILLAIIVAAIVFWAKRK